MSRCYICLLPETEHGPTRHGLVYAAPDDWHAFARSSGARTSAPPPYPNRTTPRRPLPVVEPTASAARTTPAPEPNPKKPAAPTVGPARKPGGGGGATS